MNYLTKTFELYDKTKPYIAAAITGTVLVCGAMNLYCIAKEVKGRNLENIMLEDKKTDGIKNPITAKLDLGHIGASL